MALRLFAAMKRIYAIGLGILGSLVCGWAAGYAWILGNKAAGAGMPQLVGLAIPINLVAALALYLVVRGSVGWAGGGWGLYAVIAMVSVLVVIGLAAYVSGVLGTSSGRIGAHVFSWGMTYAYVQAIHDIKEQTWFGE